MKKFLSLLLIIVFVLSLTACDSLLPATNNAQNNPNIQNLFSGMTEMSEVKSYFDKSLGLNINSLYSFRFYELQGDALIIQYKETDVSPYKYMFYCTENWASSMYLYPGEFVPITETVLSQQSDSDHTVSELTLNKAIESTNSFYGMESFQIISDSDGRIVRVIRGKKWFYVINYNDNHSVSTVSEFVTMNEDGHSSSIKDSDLYDINHQFDDDDFSWRYDYSYSYNPDGSADQIIEFHRFFDYDYEDTETRYEYKYDNRGCRISELCSVSFDDYQDYCEFERDNKGLVKRIKEIFEDGDVSFKNISYNSDGLILDTERVYIEDK